MRSNVSADDSIDVQPLVSIAEQKFIKGDLSADAYVSISQEEAERHVRRELADKLHRENQMIFLLFGAVASVVYIGVALVFYVSGHSGSALGATVLSMAFMAITNLFITVRRRIRK